MHTLMLIIITDITAILQLSNQCFLRSNERLALLKFSLGAQAEFIKAND